MLKTRLWMGAVLIVLVAGVLWLDGYFAPWYPILALVVLISGSLASLEILSLLPEPRPQTWVTLTAVTLLLGANWGSRVADHWLEEPPRLDSTSASVPPVEPKSATTATGGWTSSTESLAVVASVLAGVLMLLFANEARQFQVPGTATRRLAATFFVLGYLGFLPAFLIQLRWRPDGALALASAIFVTKSGDIGAYFTGRMLGRHHMSPILSPKKTWEGAVGGLTLATGTGVLFLAWTYPWWAAALWGLVLGAAGMVGDLMESLLKRDSGQKDASAWVPGFGGVLDVIDALLFAGPVAYFGFMCLDRWR
jgi:phosphatidate cytidylyltransferase